MCFGVLEGTCSIQVESMAHQGYTNSSLNSTKIY